VESAPIQYFLYVAFPVGFWWGTARKADAVPWSQLITVKNLILAVVVVMLLEIMVCQYYETKKN